MTPTEIADEAVAVLAELESLGATVEVDARLGLHIYTTPERPDLGDLADRIPGVHEALVTILLAASVMDGTA